MTNVILEKLLYLVVGGAGGSLLTAFLLKPKYEKQIDRLEEQLDKYENHFDEEVDKVREAIMEGYGAEDGNTEKLNDKADDDADEDIEKLKEISTDYVKRVKMAKSKPDPKSIIEKNGYQVVSELGEPEDDDEDEDAPDRNEVFDDDDDSPFYDEDEEITIITPEEFGEYRDYEKEYLFYLRDKTLVDGQGNYIEDVDNYVGYDSLNQFDAYDDDHVYVRNRKLKCDIDIYRDMRHTFANFKDS